MENGRDVDALCTLVTSDFGGAANMECVMKAQAPRENPMTSRMANAKLHNAGDSQTQ